MVEKKIKVLVVEDSAFMRRQMRRILESPGDIEVYVARDGEDGIRKARELHPDVITMDINLPGIDGITAMQYIVNEKICPVIMVSSLTQEGAMATFESLELGAFDYVSKPGGTISLNIATMANEIITKVRAASKVGTLSKLRNRVSRVKKRQVYKSKENNRPEKKIPIKKVSQTLMEKRKKKAVALGISTGGPKTLSEIIPLLPSDFGATLFIVQHMPPNFTASFAKRLNNYSQIEIVEAESGDLVQHNHGYLGKGGFQMLLRKKNNNDIILRICDHPDHFFMPSVDIMMQSVLEIYGSNTIGVLMTGMGDDGAASMEMIKQAGGKTIAESEETAVVFGMPKEAIDRGCVDVVSPSYQIIDEIMKAIDY